MATPSQTNFRNQPLALLDVRRLDFEGRLEVALRLRAAVLRFRALANSPPAEIPQAFEAATEPAAGFHADPLLTSFSPARALAHDYSVGAIATLRRRAS